MSSRRAESNDTGRVTSLVPNANFCETPRERPKAKIQDKEGISLDHKGCSWLENECTLTTTFRRILSFCVETLWSYTTHKKNELTTKMLGLAALKFFKVPENGSISHLG